MNSKSLFILIGFFLMNFGRLYAQKDNQDSISKIAIQNTELFFNKAIGQQSWLYNGAAYIGYYPNIEGTAYFQDITSFSNSTIWFEGFRYENVPLKYDIFKDVMVTLLYDRSSLLSLPSEKITHVYLNNHHFVYLKIDNSESTMNLKSGFYDLIHDGKIKLYTKHAKIIKEVVEVEVKQYFNTRTNYFLLKDGIYHAVSNESSFIAVLKDKKTNLKKYLKDNKVRFKDNPEQAMVLLANYYDELTK
ncbi:MAG: hypothetical protein K2P75_01110 [Sphingobacteriaceae bacterium]|nr:hypothetical protein [Sphingobacteriaceae bacterium]